MTPLSPFGWLYGLATSLRNSLYDRQILKSYRPNAKVISIGNLTTGGTGKTPLVSLTARLLAEKGERVCILTRGYGRTDEGKQVLVSDGGRVLVDARTGGDEPIELAHKLLGKAAVIADRDRVAAAKWAIENLDTTTFVLDDGFQHRRIERDTDIVCIDATDPFGNGELIPAGKLRESLTGLKRADAVVINRTDLVPDTSSIEQIIKREAPEAKLFRSRGSIVQMSEVKGFLDGDRSEGNADLLKNTKAYAFCAIGNPSAFFRQLELADIMIGSRTPFRDHHRYTQPDLAKLEREARRQGCDILITTAKDAVRLADVELNMPCYVAEMEIELDEIEEFKRLVTSS